MEHKSSESKKLSSDLKAEVISLNTKTVNSYQLHLEYSVIFSKEMASRIFEQLEAEVQYYTGDLAKVKVFGKYHKIPRKQVAYGDAGLTYTFSGTTVPAMEWTSIVRELRDVVSDVTKQDFNFALVNRYNDGCDYIGEHRDNEKDLVRDAAIASLSFGQQRDFIFRHKDCRGKNRTQVHPPVQLSLESGSLLVMYPPTNEFWYHSLPVRKKLVHPRLNLTFRKIKK